MMTKLLLGKVTVTFKVTSRLRALLQQQNIFRQMRFMPFLLGLLLISSLFAACGGQDSDNGAEEAAIDDPVAAEGQAVFQQNCASCHAVTGDTIIVGPSLAGIATRAGTRVEGQNTAEYIQLSILRPRDYIVEGFSDLMPSTFGTTLSGEQLDALSAYLMTLE
jgi:mono/diheme cytochrome c family protein